MIQCLARFHDTFDGSTIGGWRLHAPAPLYRCDDPFALVMTRVPEEGGYGYYYSYYQPRSELPDEPHSTRPLGHV